MQRLTYTVDRLAHFFGVFSGWLVPVIMSLVLVEVLTRYVIHRPLMLADEFSAYMLVAISFLGMAYTQSVRGHVRITALTSRLPKRTQSWFRVVTLLLGIIFTAILVWASYQYLVMSFNLGLRSETHLRIPLRWIQMTLIIGFSVMGLLLARDFGQAIMNLRKGKYVEEESMS